MLDNKIYNLMIQLVEENKSLWRIKNEYMKDAAGCPECVELWNKLEKDKEDHVKEISALLKKKM